MRAAINYPAAMQAAFLAFALAGSTQGQTFDLVCTGELTTESINGNEAKPYSVRYRVNLTDGKWCEGDCADTSPIAKTSPGVIVFESIDKDAPSERVRKINNVSRETGQHLALYTSRSIGGAMSIVTMRWKGMCEPAEFSGFPTSGKKF